MYVCSSEVEVLLFCNRVSTSTTFVQVPCLGFCSVFVDTCLRKQVSIVAFHEFSIHDESDLLHIGWCGTSRNKAEVCYSHPIHERDPSFNRFIDTVVLPPFQNDKSTLKQLPGKVLDLNSINATS